MKTKIIKVKNYNSTDNPFEVMFYESDGHYYVQVKDYEPDRWKNKKNAMDYFNWFKKNKILVINL